MLNGLAQLPIRLAIKLVSPQKHVALLVIGIQHDEVCRNSLIGLDLNDLANANTSARDLSHTKRSDQSVLIRVKVVVPAVALNIVIELLEN